MRRNLRIAAALLAASIVTTVAPAVSAAESTENHWAHTYLETWKDYGVMAGDENGDLMPDKFTSRAELAVMLNAIMDYQVQAENTFPDVEDGS